MKINSDLFIKTAKFGLILLSLYILLIIYMGTLSFAPKVEHNFYMHYALSLVENHDLNILNQLPSSAAWIVSTTFNYPEMHDYGVSLIWFPFYYLAKLLNVKSFIVAPINFQHNANYVFTFLIGAISAFFSFGCLTRWYKSYNHQKIDYYSIFVVVFGTGLFHYLFVQYNGTEVIVFAFAAIMLMYASLIDHEFNIFDFICLGIFFGFGRVIKIHFATYLIPIMFYFITNYAKSSLRQKLIAALSFTAGALPLILANTYNNFLKFGFTSTDQGYLKEFSLRSMINNQHIFDSYFGPSGLFYQMPIFLFTLMIFLYLIFEWFYHPQRLTTLEKIGAVVYLSIIFKMLLFLFAPTPSQDEFGGRNYVIDSCAHLIMLNILINRARNNRRILFAIKILLTLALTWTLLSFFWYYTIIDMVPDQRLIRYLDDPKQLLNITKMYTSNLITSLYFLPLSFKENLSYLIWLIPPAFLFYHYKKIIDLLLNKKSLRYISLFLFLLMMTTTGMNHFNNRANAEQLKASNTFRNIVIGNGMHIFTYDNFITDLSRAMEADKYKRNKDKFEHKLSLVKHFLLQAKNEVVFDNIGFIEKINNGRLPKIGILDDDSASSVLDYESPTRTQY